MPVNVLLCEGVYQSPDRIILSRLLKGYCQIMPIGSKRNMLNQLEVRRRESNSIIYGLQDRDFVKDWEIPNNQPKTWKQCTPRRQGTEGRKNFPFYLTNYSFSFTIHHSSFIIHLMVSKPELDG